ECLKIIDPRIKDFELIDKELLVDIALDKLIPINMMGDGVRKIVSLLSTIYTCKKGIVLIDEISNGFHHSVMSNLWRVLINAAIKNETQLFITTHDYDSIKGLRDAALDMYNDKVAAFSLVRNLSDELKAFHYSLENLDYALEQNSEVR
ncbi:MAG: AAA family ATPase, partial [Bacteroidales bacterium]|nr:AAA family ATPase [Bacteroidales bacterium]